MLSRRHLPDQPDPIGIGQDADAGGFEHCLGPANGPQAPPLIAYVRREEAVHRPILQGVDAEPRR